MILTCAQLCKIAYDDGIKVGAQKFAVGDWNGIRIIAIAGTKNIENVLEDISVWPALTPSRALAHAGVVNAYQELEDAVMGHIPKNLKTVFTGHSLGGGIACLFAERFRGEVVTFGSLKTYFRLWPAPDLPHTRVVRDDDPVPLVPGIMYAHRCEPVVLKDRDRQVIDIEDHNISAYIRMLKGACNER